jgi:hypothetical protein
MQSGILADRRWHSKLSILPVGERIILQWHGCRIATVPESRARAILPASLRDMDLAKRLEQHLQNNLQWHDRNDYRQHRHNCGNRDTLDGSQIGGQRL